METNTFEILEICGDGTFGIVYKAKQKSTETLVAIKRAKEVKYERPVQERIANEREILCKLQHENIISIFSLEEPLEITSSLSFSKLLNIKLNVNAIVFPYCPLTLKSLLKNYALAPHEIKSCIWMILNGVAHIHSNGVIHRDLSPSNILISDSGIIKISDFGTAWTDANNNHEPRGKMKFEVGTRYYRAPELLYSADNYSNAIDLWSLGCIFAEFFTKPASSPLFHGENDIEQLSEIFRILGVPNESTWPEMIDFPDYGKITFVKKDCDGLTIKQLPKAKPQDVQFISKFLKYPSMERMMASKALLDPLLDADDFSKFCINIQDLKKRI
ncbi:kinase-like domain-containing protein [Gigaspora rosea]|uniref:cyclin-dependent kinase n=1 Tax=Gigaspora rosea TaxID=44941 RepID=A0A397U1A0_9GLOM|nr:kinase-like domain-containing protein [Gigaspora rosea]CAG8569230.1 13651_t:CDS:2 [Gigaspora rosea]